jgi:hypothetical protein
MGDNWYYICTIAFNLNSFVGVKVIVLVSNAVERGFELRSRQTKDYKIGICFFSTKHAALRRANTGWLRIRITWNDMSFRRLLFFSRVLAL